MKNGILPDYFPDYQKKAALDYKKEKEKVFKIKNNRNKYYQSILFIVLNYLDFVFFHLIPRMPMIFVITNRPFSKTKRRRNSYSNART